MAKFRTNHNKQSASNGMITKVGIFVFLVGGLFFAFNFFSGKGGSFSTAIEHTEELLNPNTDNPKGPSEPGSPLINEAILPTSTTGQIISHSHYALSYSEAHEQAEWVAYELDREELYIPNVERTGNFRPDPKVRKASASTRDYYGTGYDRGHLVPAGDMAFSELAMSESFYMTNISPQIRNFNGGIWRELEETVRDWGKKFRHLYIVTGPVLTQDIREYIGDNKVAVPEYFYKVILDIDDPERKGIGFVIPNEVSYDPLSNFAVTIDEVENLTSIDFFHNLLEDDEEEKLESHIDMKLWFFNERRFEKRKTEWNKRK